MGISSNIIVEIDNRQDKIEITQNIEKIILDCINRALDLEGFNSKLLISIILVDNDTIRDINLQYRDIDRVTDVLSFPMLDIEAGHRDLDPDDFVSDIDPESGAIILGDIILALEKAKEQAEEYGHSFQRELGFLVVHGVLHLLGYDHMEERDRELMRSREEIILEAVNLHRS